MGCFSLEGTPESLQENQRVDESPDKDEPFHAVVSSTNMKMNQTEAMQTDESAPTSRPSWISTSESLSNILLFIIILCVSVPSVFIHLFAICRLHRNTKLSVFAFRTILHVSLFTTCTCVPFFLLELYYNFASPLSPSICKLWLVIDYASIVSLGLLVCWASVQRHILIFGPIFLKKLQSSCKFKLIPTLVALGFPLAWYSTLISLCVDTPTATGTLQCRPCFENDKSLFLLDTIFSLILPLSVTILATTFLVARIIRLRCRRFRLTSKKWRRCKRLTRQMILFSTIYLIGLLPYVLVTLNSLYYFWPSIKTRSYLKFADALSYVPCCFSSFLSMYAFPEIWTNRRHHRHHQKPRRKQRPAVIPCQAT